MEWYDGRSSQLGYRLHILAFQTYTHKNKEEENFQSVDVGVANTKCECKWKFKFETVWSDLTHLQHLVHRHKWRQIVKMTNLQIHLHTHILLYTLHDTLSHFHTNTHRCKSITQLHVWHSQFHDLVISTLSSWLSQFSTTMQIFRFG